MDEEPDKKRSKEEEYWESCLREGLTKVSENRFSEAILYLMIAEIGGYHSLEAQVLIGKCHLELGNKKDARWWLSKALSTANPEKDKNAIYVINELMKKCVTDEGG